MAYFEDVISQVTELCQHFNYEVIEQFGYIIIKTKYERWKFEPIEGRKTTLYHENIRKSGNNYHQQFTRFISPKGIVKYIHKHEQYVYSAKKQR